MVMGFSGRGCNIANLSNVNKLTSILESQHFPTILVKCHECIIDISKGIVIEKTKNCH